MFNSNQIDDVEQLFVRSCLECSPQPGDSHHWLKYSDINKVNTAAAEFLKKELLMKKTVAVN